MGSLGSSTSRIWGIAGRGITGLCALVAFLILGRADQAVASSTLPGRSSIDAWQDQAGDLQLSYILVGDVGPDSVLPPPRIE